MLRQLASRAAAASPSNLCSALSSTSSLALSCSARAVATEAARGTRRTWAASSDCDGQRSSSSPTMMMIASSSGSSCSFPGFDASFAPSTSYSLMSSWGSLGAQMRRRAFSTESETPAAGTGLNPLLRAPGPLPPPSSSSAEADVVPLASASSSSASPSGALPPPLTTAAQRQLRSRAVLKNIRISPKKLARFAKLVSGMHVEDALAQCAVARETKAAGLLRGVIASAAANARANHGNLLGGGVGAGVGGGAGSSSENGNFRVAEAVVGRAPTPTRPWYHGKGRTGVRHLYRSHLTIELEATSKPPLTRYQKPLLERQGKGRPRRLAATTRRRRAEEEVEVAAAEAVA